MPVAASANAPSTASPTSTGGPDGMPDPSEGGPDGVPYPGGGGAPNGGLRLSEDTGHLPRSWCERMRGRRLVVLVRAPGHDRRFAEVLDRRRRARFPLEPDRAPRVVTRVFAVAHRPNEVDRGDEITEAEHCRAGRRHHVEHLEFVGVRMVAPRHPEITQHELRKESEVESEEDDQGGDRGPK